MTQAEVIAFIDAYFRNSAIDGFQSNRMNTVLKELAGGSVPGSYSTFADFETAYTTNPNSPIQAFVSDVSEYGFNDVVLQYLPGVGVSVAGLQLIIDLR